MSTATSDPRIVIARRCALELRDGEVVNLGFGIPTLTVNYVPVGTDVIFHTENGCFGFGPKPDTRDADSDMTSASNEPITIRPGAAIMDLATSLGAMRTGYIATAILGGIEADQEGNLANWASRRQGRWWPGIGGAMDVCY
jgi:acetate CoA/acetoacetate CoA-transferase beta subunit